MTQPHYAFQDGKKASRAQPVSAPDGAVTKAEPSAVWCDYCEGPANPDDFNPIAGAVICARCIENLWEAKCYEQACHQA